MRNYKKAVALALGSVLALSLFVACGETESSGEVSYARICYNNLSNANYVNEADTKVEIKGAKDIKGYTKDRQSVSDYKQIATYSNGVFTAKSEGYLTFKTGNTTGRVEVVPAYAVNPNNQYSGTRTDLDLNQGAKYLGNTHDPSYVEVEANGASTYYLFSTGWGTGNDVHVSYDLLTWEYAGKTAKSSQFSDPEIFPEEVKSWMGARNNSGDIQWWAPDIVPAPDGGYWLYTCLVMSDSVLKNATYNSENTALTPSTTYSRACIVLYHTDTLSVVYDDNDKASLSDPFKYVGVLMQSAIPQNNSHGGIDVNSIDPQIIYDTDGKMYMAYGSFGTGNWLLELDPQTGLRKDGVYSDGQFKDLLTIRKERNKVVSGDENSMGSTDETQNAYYKDFIQGKEVKSDFYGKLISLGAMEAPVLARHDNVKVADETVAYDAAGEPENVEGKSYFYSMHSYNWLASNYQMWGGRSESVWGVYNSTTGALVRNVDVGNSGNQGNKYMGAFKWRNESKAKSCTEIDIVLPGHNDLYTARNGASFAAYITRTFDFGGEAFVVQNHQYYLNSMGDICINPNRYGGEIDRSVSKEELLALTDGGRFEMAVLTNAADAIIESPGSNAKLKTLCNVSFEVKLTEDNKITRDGTEIGSWQMYGKGYIKFTFSETLKGAGSYDSGETVYYGVVRPTWLSNRNQSGFTISCMGHTAGKTQSMAMFMNSYSTLTGGDFEA